MDNKSNHKNRLSRLIIVGQLHFNLYYYDGDLIDFASINGEELLQCGEESLSGKGKTLSDYVSDCLSNRMQYSGLVVYDGSNFVPSNYPPRRIIEDKDDNGILIFFINESGDCEKFTKIHFDNYLQCEIMARKKDVTFKEAFMDMAFNLYCEEDLQKPMGDSFRDYLHSNFCVLTYNSNSHNPAASYLLFRNTHQIDSINWRAKWREVESIKICAETTYEVCEKEIKRLMDQDTLISVFMRHLVRLENNMLRSKVFYDSVVTKCFERTWQWLGCIKNKAIVSGSILFFIGPYGRI